jgi:hypothetical protein
MKFADNCRPGGLSGMGIEDNVYSLVSASNLLVEYYLMV